MRQGRLAWPCARMTPKSGKRSISGGGGVGLASQVALGRMHLPVQEIKRCWLDPWARKTPGGGHGNRSGILAWEIPWTEEPGGLMVLWSQRVGQD